MDSIIRVGHSKRSVREARSAIMDILKAGADEKTKRAALKALSDGLSIIGTTVSHCTFYGSRESAAEDARREDAGS